ncbi:MAG: hypothetical protein GXO86_05040 [Chlorobi bacterium]|nr:hypothetical protein [Chlorobiota bacterium]
MERKIAHYALYSLIIIMLVPIALIGQDKRENNRNLISNNFQATNLNHWEARANLVAEKSPVLHVSDVLKQVAESNFKTSPASGSYTFSDKTVSIGTLFRTPVVIKAEKSENLYKNTTNKNQKTDISYFVKDKDITSGKILLAFFEDE